MKRIGLLSIIILYTVSVSFSSGSKIFKWKGTRDLTKVKIENVIINDMGIISLSPAVDTIFQSTEVFLWDCVYDSRGNLYVASGNEGKVFKITNANQVFTVFTSEKGAEIFSLAADKEDNIYVGESPSGIIYKISKNGNVKEFFATDEKYIWNLLFDNKGMLFVATGDRGKLFRISADGKGKVYYSSTENHIVTLLLYNGKLYAGTEPNALFVEIDKEGKATVLFDTDENEVHSMIGMGNKIFFATLSRPITVMPSSYTSFFSNGSIEGSKMEKSILYKFDINKKTVTSIWSCTTPPIYALSEFSDNKILIGTENGRLYGADEDGRISQMNKFEDSPILSINKGLLKNSYIILTGNLGNVIKIGPDLSRTGRIISDVYDTGRMSIFGRIDWDSDVPSGTMISLWLRVGNKKDPVEDWTNWKKMKKGANINIPPARFIQIKSELETTSGWKSPYLKDISISYLPENRKPVLEKLVICPVGVNASEGYDPMLGPQAILPEKERNFYTDLGFDLPLTLYGLAKGKRCAYWVATDPDRDSLYFSFFYRGDEEKEWKELEKDLMRPSFTWDETTLPDGIYFAKVSASDERDNPASRALTSEIISESFIIDNSAPDVEVNSVKRRGENIEVSVTAKDKLSLLKSASFSINGGEWNVILPEDGIFDRKEEKFLFTHKAEKKGEYTVVVKVTDLSLNTGTGKGTVEVR